MGDYKNVSKYWEFRLLDTDYMFNTGVGATLYANQRRLPGSNHVEFNIVYTFGEGAELTVPEHDNTRFCFRPKLRTMGPTDWCLEHGLLGNLDFVLETKSGGWYEGGFMGTARWRKKEMGPVIVFGLPETSMNKNGKVAWVSWNYPAPVWSKGTQIIISGAYEAMPLPDTQPVAVPV